MTVFGAETEFDGTIKFSDRLVITGRFTGTIEAPDGDLEIARGAVCDVDRMKVNSVVVSGSVRGKIEAADRVEMCSGSAVESDVTAARLRIAGNVDFSGQVTMIDSLPDMELFATASDEYRQALIVHSDVIK